MEQVFKQSKSLVLVLENPNYIINIGHVIRNVNAFGVDALLVVDGQKRLEDDLEVLRNRKSLLKHSASAIKHTIVKRFDRTEDCIAFLKEYQYQSVVTSPHIKGQNNVQLHKANYSVSKMALWFGNESKGISGVAVKACDFCINIKMRGQVESLNLSTSTGVVLYEITKQRNA